MLELFRDLWLEYFYLLPPEVPLLFSPLDQNKFLTRLESAILIRKLLVLPT